MKGVYDFQMSEPADFEYQISGVIYIEAKLVYKKGNQYN
jgi:hypothetical protein